MATVRTASDDLREIIMGAQDNLTNVLAVVLGVAIGSGETSTVALAGLSAGLAEAISMGGVLYNATKAERDLAIRAGRSFGKRPVRAGVVTALAALLLTGCVVADPPAVAAPPRAPAPQVEVAPPSPGPAYVWVPGHWVWRRRAYVWVPGYWAVPTAPGYVWVPGHWAARGAGYVWIEGRWRARESEDCQPGTHETWDPDRAGLRRCSSLVEQLC